MRVLLIDHAFTVLQAANPHGLDVQLYIAAMSRCKRRGDIGEWSQKIWLGGI